METSANNYACLFLSFSIPLLQQALSFAYEMRLVPFRDHEGEETVVGSTIAAGSILEKVKKEIRVLNH